MKYLVFFIAIALLGGCAGMKVIHPNDHFEKNKDTRALDYKDGKIQIVETYTCKYGYGNRFAGVGKTEEEARKEALAQCQSEMVISFCDKIKIECKKN